MSYFFLSLQDGFEETRKDYGKYLQQGFIEKKKKNQQNETNTLKTSNRNKYCWKLFLKYIASSNSTGEFMTHSLSFLEGVDQKNTVNMNVKSHEGASC